MSLKIRQLDRLLLLLNDSDTLNNRRGRPGEILYDWTNNTLRVYSARPGDPDGGIALVKADLSNVDPTASIVINDAEIGSLKVQGSTITSMDSSTINIEQSLGVTGSVNIGGTATVEGQISAAGLQFNVGSTVNEFSTDRTMGDRSDAAVPTERTVVEYLDNVIETRVFQDSATPPPDPLLGSFWLDTTDYKLYHRQNEDFWVEIAGPITLDINKDAQSTPLTLVERDSAGDIYAQAVYAPDSVMTSNLRAGTLETSPGTIEGSWSLVGESRLQSTWADLAEYHQSDQEWAPGTVIKIGAEGLMTQTTDLEETAVVGVVTTQPAYVMNQDCAGPRVCLALAGCIPVKARGPIRPGDCLVSSDLDGHAQSTNNPRPGTVIGKSLDHLDDAVVGTVRMLVSTS